MGSRFELIERKASTKGKTLRLSLDQDLQEIAERSLEKMIDNVAARRILRMRIGRLFLEELEKP